MPPEWTAENMWSINDKDKGVCIIYLDGAAKMPGSWTIWFDGDCDYSNAHEDFPVDEHMKEITWAME